MYTVSVSQHSTSPEVLGYNYPTYFQSLSHRETNSSVLIEVLERAKQATAQHVVVFDLDATILDNRPRVARILREFGYHKNLPALQACEAKHISDWSLAKAMVACGLSPQQADQLDAEARQYWNERFFTSEYCAEDVAIAGAPAFLRQLMKTPVQIAYCTGRHTAMIEGTLVSFRREGFPLPDQRRIHLFVKEMFDMSDDEFKSKVYPQLCTVGTLLAVFDNEPSHINSYHEAFPEALAVHLLTMESGRGIAVAPSVPSICDFIYPSSKR